MKNIHQIYSALISLSGVGLVVWGIIQIPTYSAPLTFLLLVLLAVLAQGTMAAFVGGTSSISVSSAISLATASLFGAVAGAVAAAAAEIGLWVYRVNTKQVDNRDRSALIEWLGLNVGMNGIAIFLAGLTYHFVLDKLAPLTFLGQTVPWLAAALVGDQVKLGLLSIIRFQANGTRPLQTWKENRRVIPVNVLVLSAGSGLLSVAVSQFDMLGIAVFFLPIVLSAYSFRLYANQTKKQMDQLEELVELRTSDLAEANEELADLNQDKDAFLAVLTHDMRTPLTSIKGYASILRDRDLGRGQQIHISKIILRSEENLLEIVNNILDIEKLQSGTPVSLERNEFDLALLVKSAAEPLESLAMEKNITLCYDEVPSPVMVTADEKKIQRVMTNLISNAIKYTPEGGKITVGSRLKGSHALFEVVDTGYGIPEDELPHIFDRFRRVKRHQKIAVGTGLGLAIVKSLVAAHDGEISVISKEEVGSTFTVKLPI